MRPAEEPYADRVHRSLASIAEGILGEGITYDCPWDDFRFMYFREKDSETAARELVAWRGRRESRWSLNCAESTALT
jgi:hypothetical protein